MTKLFSILFSLLMFQACNNAPTLPNENKEQRSKVKPAKKRDKVTSGKVVGISDGDTFQLLVEESEPVRVRLHGVDAPEKAQDYGTQAKAKLSELIFSKTVKVDQRAIDRYGRIVAVVYVDGLNVNEELLRSGLVWHYTAYDKTDRWARLMHEAKENKRGLWSKKGPTPPWQFRKEKRKGAGVT